MLKPLRHPVVFVLLTASLAAWIYLISLLVPGSRTIRWHPTRIHAPLTGMFENPAFASAGYPVSWWWDGNEKLPDYAYLYELPDGYHFERESEGRVPPAIEGVAPTARLAAWRNKGDAWGLALPAIEQHTHEYSVNWLVDEHRYANNHAVLTAMHKTGVLPPQSVLSLNWPFALHDAALGLALIAWLFAFFTIPTWKLWRSLTPAQRRRNRHACPDCGYDRSATPGAPCPECGLDPATHK